MKSMTNTVTTFASLTLVAGLSAMPVAAPAQQKAVEYYQQYVENEAKNDTAETVDRTDVRSAVDRLDHRVNRLETTQEALKSKMISQNEDRHDTASVRDTQASVPINR